MGFCRKFFHKRREPDVSFQSGLHGSEFHWKIFGCLICKEQFFQYFFSNHYFSVNTLMIAKPEKARQAEAMLVQMARTGQIGGRMSEDDLVSSTCIDYAFFFTNRKPYNDLTVMASAAYLESIFKYETHLINIFYKACFSILAWYA